MTARSEEKRPRSARVTARRDPAIWHGTYGAAAPSAERAAPQVSRGRSFWSWRLVSGLIVVGLLIVLGIVFTSDAFYVHSVAVGGLDYMTENEIFALTGAANLHVFWIDPAEIRRNLLQSPTIADAQVEVSLSAPLLTVYVEERAPALVWEQAGIAVWVDVRGRIMRQREARADLLVVQADSIMDGPPSGEVPVDVVTGALQLHQLLPAQTVLRYHPDHGLGYNDARGWEVWLGTGTNMPERVLIYQAITEFLTRNNLFPSVVNVTNPDNPFYSLISP